MGISLWIWEHGGEPQISTLEISEPAEAAVDKEDEPGRNYRAPREIPFSSGAVVSQSWRKKPAPRSDTV